MLRHVLHSLLSNAPNLLHISLQTGTKHYVGPFEFFSKIRPHDPPFHEDLPRLPVPNFYYALEDILFEETSKGPVPSAFTRPSASTRAAGSSSRGVWDGYLDCSDADLMAEQHIWAAVDPFAQNEAFNCVNGDVFKWKQLWRVLAGKFEMEWVEMEEGRESGFSLVEMMKGKGGCFGGDCEGEGACED
ncbi:putative steroid 5beta-reductase [Cinnamomum micranthum f. kanehirae]|uniref:Putative steroid 5beta-reductase n=1 Tax=Cinnamomum micranthum f. kanehirae TaxID=337451 RepID=A0A443NWQ5_9MAGN|nr:putative steroid 5beta-reductase [Cinnamomum micranthum f. kanehirae]